MNIDLFSEIVKGLILDNDEVTLPGLGTFVSEVVPSVFSDKGYTINPPYRKLSFRSRESGNGRMLAEFYSTVNGTDFETSERILSEFIAGLKATLQTKKLVVFPGLGRLRATKENAFFFIPDEDLDIYPYGVGLEPVSLKTHEETPEEVAHSVAALRELVAEPEPAQESVAPVTEPVEVTEAVGSVAEEESSLTGEKGQVDVKDVPVADAIEETVPVTLTSSATEAVGSVTEAVGSATETEGSMVGEAETPADKSDTGAEKEKEEVKEKGEETGHKTRKSAWRVALIVAASLIGLALVALGIFILLAHIAPDFIDSILYSPEELRIINY